MSLVVAGKATRVLTAAQLEDGDDDQDGRLGTGAGSWRLFVATEGELQVMSLGYSAEGFLANLSRGRPSAEESVGVGPDLVVEALSVSNSTPFTGARFSLSATVINQGKGDAEATMLRYYRSDNAHISTTDVQVGIDPVISLSASGSSREFVDLTAPLGAGRYYFGACVDAVANEFDTANNCSRAFAVHVLDPPRQPDLVVVSPAVSDSRPVVGEAFTLSATVRNGGTAASGASTLRYYRSADATISRADTSMGTDAIAALAPGGRSDESIAVTAPSQEGVYYYGACVDAVTDESDTTNNCSASVEVTVAQPPPLHGAIAFDAEAEQGDCFFAWGLVVDQSLGAMRACSRSRSVGTPAGETTVSNRCLSFLAVVPWRMDTMSTRASCTAEYSAWATRLR